MSQETVGVYFVSVSEAALRLGIGRSTLYKFVGDDLHLVKIGRRSVVSLVELDRLAVKLAAEAGVVLETDSAAG